MLYTDRVIVADASSGRFAGRDVAFPLEPGTLTTISDMRGEYVLIPADPDHFWEASRFVPAPLRIADTA